MIKIKNYIFNENEIKRIEPYEQKVSLISERDIKGIKVVQKDINTIVDNVTVDDIEWNYGEDENNKLRENNRELVETNMKLAIENKKLREKINFAENILYDYLYKDGKITEELYLKYKGEE